MLGKAEIPILILAGCYIFIIGLVIVLVSLIFISALNINQFVKNQRSALVSRHCKIYLEQGQQQSYDGCVKQAITYAQKEK